MRIKSHTEILKKVVVSGVVKTYFNGMVRIGFIWLRTVSVAGSCEHGNELDHSV